MESLQRIDGNSIKQNSRRKRVPVDTHRRVPRPSAKLYRRSNDIYVTNKSDFRAQVNQCQKLLDSEKGEAFLHCLGNAIARGINLALTLVEKSDGAFDYEANTSTIELIDDFHPLRDEDDFTIQQRKNSALHIRVFRRTTSNTSTKTGNQSS